MERITNNEMIPPDPVAIKTMKPDDLKVELLRRGVCPHRIKRGLRATLESVLAGEEIFPGVNMK